METALLAATASAVSAGAAVAGTAVQVSSANAQAKAAAQAAALEQQQYEQERRSQALAAQQQQNALRAEMERSMSAGIALSAARGLDPYGPTGRTLMADTMEEAAADLETLRANAGTAQSRISLGQQQTALRGRSAVRQANDQALGAIVGGVGSLARTGHGYLSRADTTRPAAGSGNGNGGGR